ncbi:hypothetical protein TNCV_2743011 [Trichonephila clavipes]|nr:hypothetical protein TNCV_2743011 [Trichonephila clavipes]
MMQLSICAVQKFDNCTKLPHRVNEEIIDITLLSPFVLSERIGDSSFHGYQSTQNQLDFASHLSRFLRLSGLGLR